MRSGSSTSMGNLDTENRQVLTGKMGHTFTSANDEFITETRAGADRLILHYGIFFNNSGMLFPRKTH